MYSLRDLIKVYEMTYIWKKYLNNSEVTKLINHTKDSVKKFIWDTKKSSEFKSDANEFLKCIQDVRVTWKKEKGLHPNIITRLMKTSAGIARVRYGFYKKGFKKSTDGKVPPNFSK